jgi:hypothetical protein
MFECLNDVMDCFCFCFCFRSRLFITRRLERLHNLISTLLQFTVYSLQFTVYSLQFSVYSFQF